MSVNITCFAGIQEKSLRYIPYVRRAGEAHASISGKLRRPQGPKGMCLKALMAV